MLAEPGINNTGISSRAIGHKTATVIKQLAKVWYIVEAKCKDFQGRRYPYALARPTQILFDKFHLEQDIFIVFDDTTRFDRSQFVAFSTWMISHILKNKADKLCIVIVSSDKLIKNTIKELINSDSESRIIIPFQSDEIINSSLIQELTITRLNEFLCERDLFDHRSPLCNDSYFFGREHILQELYDRYKSGENSGLFGLRKIGKTSLLYALQRRLEFRDEPFIFIDCEAIHLKRWNEVLKLIITRLLEKFKLLPETLLIDFDSRYTLKEAQESFATDLKKIAECLDKGRVLLILDEIEHLTFDTSPSEHWKTGQDFLLLWQSIRATFQSERWLLSFIITGTNPHAIETTILPGGYENPIRSLVPPKYLSGFNASSVKEMVSYIGKYMGMDFDEDVYEDLTKDYNGNPFLIRQACSYIHHWSASSRPIKISREFYSANREKIEFSLSAEIDLILESLEQRYSEEYELLKYLANNDHETFSYYAKLSSKYINHLKKYGIVQEENFGYSICIKAVEKRLREKLQFNSTPRYVENQTLMELISEGESSTLEFKATLLWDIDKNCQERELEKEVLKAIASFMNSSGGILLIGVKDDGTILGLNYDLTAMKWKNYDQYQKHLANNILVNKIGGNLACLCNISFPKVSGKYICKVDIAPSTTLVEIDYRKDKNQQEKKYFFIRNNASAKFLEGIDMVRYCMRRWPGGV